MSEARDPADVLVVGAGPTGLTLGLALAGFGAAVRVIDREAAGAAESRALVVHPRTLEVFEALGAAEPLLARSRRALWGTLYGGGRAVARLELGDVGAEDSAFPHVAFVSQSTTEAVLGERLRAAGVEVERRVELVSFSEEGSGVACRLRHPGHEETMYARYVVGADGAHSTVRRTAGIPFQGDAYPQEFLLADLEVDGPVEPDILHIYVAGRGVMVLFPLGSPAPWRLLGSAGRVPDANGPAGSSEASLGEAQAVADAFAPGLLRLHDPVWLARFRIHRRQAARYRAGRAFLAGDAAHIHSPAGGQGMNTGIQDGYNLGWKLSLVARGAAPEELLDSYEAERLPVGRALLAFTDRLFSAGTSTTPWARFVRSRIVPRVMPSVLATPRRRARLFRRMSQLDIAYSGGPLQEGLRGARGPRPRPGDRLPDAQVRDGQASVWLSHALGGGAAFRVLWCGDAPDETVWRELSGLCEGRRGLVSLHTLGRHGGLHDPDGRALGRLGVPERGSAHYLVRPDGHVAVRGEGSDLSGVRRFLDRWLPVGGT